MNFDVVTDHRDIWWRVTLHYMWMWGLCAFFCGVVGGVTSDRLWHTVLLWSGLAFLAGILIFRPTMQYFLCVSVACVAFLYGIMHGGVAREQMQHALLWQSADAPITIREAIVLQDPQRSLFRAQTRIALRSCADVQSGDLVKCPVETTVLITDPFVSLPSLRHAGMVTCTIQSLTSQGITGTYASFLAVRNIGSVCVHHAETPIVPIVPTAWIDRAFLMLSRVRLWAHTEILSVLPQPAAGLGIGLLFGGDDLLSRSLRDDFARAGMSHIVAVSGYNIALIGQAFLFVLLGMRLQRRVALVGAMSGIVLFVCMIGAPVSGVRAAIMGGGALLLLVCGRIGSAMPLLLLAADLMAWFMPLAPIYDVGFQLSFGATVGMILVYAAWERRWHSLFMRWPLMSIAAMTLSAQIMVAPLLLYHFGMITAMAFVANILIVPLVPLAMALTGVTLLAASMHSILGSAIGTGAYGVLSAIIVIVQWCARQDFLVFTTTHVAGFWIFLWYAMCMWFVMMLNGTSAKQKEKATV